MCVGWVLHYLPSCFSLPSPHRYNYSIQHHMPLQIKLASIAATLLVPTACPSRESQTIALWKLGAGGVRQPQQNTIHLCSHMGFSGAPWTHVFQFLVCFYLVSRVLKILPSFVIAFWGDLYSVSLYHGFQKSHPSRIKFNMRKRVKICDSLFLVDMATTSESWAEILMYYCLF